MPEHPDAAPYREFIREQREFIREQSESIRELIHENREWFREFMREQQLRLDRTLNKFAADLERDRVEIRRQFHEDLRPIHEGIRELLARSDDLRAESRAQTQALLHVLDKLSNGGAAGGTAPAG